MKIYTILTLLIFCLFHRGIQAQSTFHVSAGAIVTTKGNSVITLSNAKFSNNGTFSGTSGTVHFVGDGSNANTTIEGTGTTIFKNLTINKTANNAQLNQNIVVTGNLTLTSGGVSLNSGNIDFGGTGSLLNETETNRVFGAGGYLQATTALNAPNNSNPANLGAIITSTANLSSTVIKRAHSPFVLNGNGINRNFDISPANNTGLNATLKFIYLDAELNGNVEANLALWKSTNAGTNFTALPSTNDATSNFIQSTGISSLGLFSGGAAPISTPFKTTWIATGGNITIPTNSTYLYNYTINYRKKGDTSFSTVSGQTGNYTILGLTATDTIQVEITGVFPHFFMNNNATERTKLLSVDAWGNQNWKSMNSAFWGCSNLTYNATDNPDLSSVTNMRYMFLGCSKFNGNIGSWNTGNVTNMSGVFADAIVFNQNIGSWNTANVTDMYQMFQGAVKFNQDIGSWNTGNVTGMAQMFLFAAEFNKDLSQWNTANVTSMRGMFSRAIKFNQPITNWNTAKVTDMVVMFDNASAFNQNIGAWNTANVTDMSYMFNGSSAFNGNIGGWNTANVTNMSNMFTNASAFNQNIGSWNTAKVTNMTNMFASCLVFNGAIGGWNTANVTNMNAMFAFSPAFNQNIGSWNTAKVTNMSVMFYGCSAFNGDIGGWNTANVTTMSFMFSNASAFNQNIGSWNVDNVTNMASMFENATKFNQALTNWNTAKVTNMTSMFKNARVFNQDLSVLKLDAVVSPGLTTMLDNSGLSAANYDATLTGWLSQNKTGLTLGAAGLTYCTAEAARTSLITPIASGGKGWTITGDVSCGPPAPTASAQSHCQGKTVADLVATGQNIKWYSVAAGGTALATTTTLTTATYYATQTVNGIESNSRTAVSVTVNPSPTATASSNSPICAGSTLNLLGGNQGLVSYAWTGVNSFSSTLQNPSIPSAITLANGTYRVTVRNNNGCTASAITSVVVNASPTATATNNSPICAGNTINLLGGNQGLASYAWTGANSFSSALQNPSIPSATPLASGMYQVRVTNANGCTATATTSVVVNALPTATASSNSPICAGSTLNLLGGNQGLVSYAWTGVNSFSSTLQNPSIPSATPLVSGTYQVTVTNANGCTALATTSVMVNPIPATPTTASDVTIYKGNSTTLVATGCTGQGFAIKWYETNTNNLVTMPVAPSVTTKYYAKCEQFVNGVTCTSGKSNDATVSIANRIFVDISKASTPMQNGTSWTTAYGDLQTGLAQATSGVQNEATEVWVAKGTYKPTVTIDRNVSFGIPSNVKVYGGFFGTEDDLNARDFRTNITVLSGEIGNQQVKDDNSNHVVSFEGSSVNTFLDGFTITGGYANFYAEKSANITATSPPVTTTVERGGGIILTAGANPLIINCTFMNNAATTGAAIYANESAPHIANCKFMGNQGTFGSAIYLESNSNAQIDNSLFSGNRGIGALYNNYSNPILTNCTFGGNGGYNGGIFNSNSQPSVTNSIFWGNTTQFNDTQSTITYSIVQGGYSGVGNLNYDPQFVSPTSEGLAPNITGDYHLKSSSLGIDRGNNGSILLTDVDLDGYLRRYNGGRVDMGAYEFQGNSVSSIVISVASGNWESNSTWDVGRVPKIGDLVIINNNHTVNLNGMGNAKNIEYRGTGTLKLNTTNGKLNIGF